jgi:4-aminobutyrate aminotransferase-like enzyme
MVALELVDDRTAKTPVPELTARVVTSARANGLLIKSCGAFGNVLRILVPLVAADDEVDLGLAILEEAIAMAG